MAVGIAEVVLARVGDAVELIEREVLGQPEQRLGLRDGAPGLASDDRNRGQSRMRGLQERAGEPLGLGGDDGDVHAGVERLDNACTDAGVEGVVA